MLKGLAIENHQRNDAEQYRRGEAEELISMTRSMIEEAGNEISPIVRFENRTPKSPADIARDFDRMFPIFDDGIEEALDSALSVRDKMPPETIESKKFFRV